MLTFQATNYIIVMSLLNQINCFHLVSESFLSSLILLDNWLNSLFSLAVIAFHCNIICVDQNRQLTNAVRCILTPLPIGLAHSHHGSTQHVASITFIGHCGPKSCTRSSAPTMSNSRCNTTANNCSGVVGSKMTSLHYSQKLAYLHVHVQGELREKDASGNQQRFWAKVNEGRTKTKV